MEPQVSDKSVDREKTCPFLLRTFVKVNGFHPIALFEDNRLPVEDEHQIYTWKDATLREVVTYLRSLPPGALSLTLRHPAARFSFKLVFPDATSRGQMATKELGTVHARDLIDTSQLKPEEEDTAAMEVDQTTTKDWKPDDGRTLEELRVMAGDWLLVCVHLPQKAMGMAIAGAAGNAPTLPTNAPSGSRVGGRGAAASAAWASGPNSRGGGRGAPQAEWGRGRGSDLASGGHWRGRGGASGVGRGSSARDGDRDRPGPRDRRPSPSGRDRDRRPSPTGRDRDRDKYRSRSRSRSRSPRSRSRSRSRSPPRRRRD
ncbi:hypothetical protein FRB99_003780 [Tulasnella sp. 403]|nr:hypothetical protein FRB99_003780 [Tulasnella sp. 403]